MSLRAEFVRLALRWFIKRKTGPRKRSRRRGGGSRASAAWCLLRRRERRRSASTSTGSRPSASQPANGRTTVTSSISTAADMWRARRYSIATSSGASRPPRAPASFILDHRLAPEHPFPAALDDALKAYRRLVADGVDPRRMAVMGESSGGGLVLRCCSSCATRALRCRPQPSRFRPGPIWRSPAIRCGATPGPIR